MTTHRRTFPGRPEEVSRARHFTYHFLRDAPVVTEVCLMVSEVTTNAVLHTNSGRPGGHFTLTLTVEHGRVHAEVEDDGSPMGDVPHVEAGDAWDAEHGRGLAIVDTLADKYGTEVPNVVWFEVTWG